MNHAHPSFCISENNDGKIKCSMGESIDTAAAEKVCHQLSKWSPNKWEIH
jgi:hypothetical protein